MFLDSCCRGNERNAYRCGGRQIPRLPPKTYFAHHSSLAGADREPAMMQTLANAIARRCSTIWVLFLAGAIIVLASPQIAAAEETYPSRPIRLIVPFPPGGPTDVMGRLISLALSDQLRQQVYVDNRPGAGSTLAGKIAATAEPDGYTLILGSAAKLANGATVYTHADTDT